MSADGKADILGQMVEEYGDRLFRFMLRNVGDRHLAEDIVQETFLRALLNLQRYDQNRSAGPWLFRIALNLSRNWRRRQRETPMAPADMREPAAAADPERTCLERESERELMQALRTLPAMYREPLLLKHVSGFSYAEIGKVLNLELSLVKNRLYRGRIMLRQAYQKARRECDEPLPRSSHLAGTC